MKKILITGGPVHGKIDDVKLVTNKFNGGRIAKLADILSSEFEIIYLCSKSTIKPKNQNIKIVIHDGIYEYYDLVLQYSKDVDSVILGAAVANLVPKEVIKGKFPSHNYREGDTIHIPFIIAPRVVDAIKKVNPKVHLFPFKLLSGTSHEELIRASYKMCLDSHATAVIANDARDLNKKYIITKEKSIIEYTDDTYHEFIRECLNDKYYHTELFEDTQKYTFSIDINSSSFKKEEQSHLIFGCVAERHEDGFLCSSRGKNSMDDIVFVKSVDDKKLTVHTSGKASLNAPLLNNLFKNNPNVKYIIHTHTFLNNVNTYEYAIPGTLRDSLRNIKDEEFNIANHGSFKLIKEIIW